MAVVLVAGGMAPTRIGETATAPRAPGTSVTPDPDLRPARRGHPAVAPGFESGRAKLSVRVNGQSIAFRIMAVTALPGEELVIETEIGGRVGLRYAGGVTTATAPGKWTWRAPDNPGIVPLRLASEDDSRVAHLNVLVLHPRSHVVGEELHGFRIGRYREKPLGGNSVYLPPSGFIEVGPGDHDVLVSPHFTLGQFLCKQLGTPSYLALSMPLVAKLEEVLAAVNDAGYAVETLHVMSGYRTPAYNASIGNKTVYSRHLWGDAADVFVDVDGNGYMDDLDGNGRSNLEDARLLSQIVDRVEGTRRAGVQPGGVAVYRANAVHGPFVHVDARGYRARW